MQDISPEERLLRLIRADKKKPAQKEGLVEEKTEARPKPKDKVSLSPRLNLAKIKEYFSFNQLNQLLLIVLVILGLYLLTDFLIISPNRIEEKVLAVEAVKDNSLKISQEVAAPAAKPVSYYTQATKTKNLFTATGPETEQERPSASFLEMVSKFKLQGIISGPGLQAVIEDTKTNQVYFLSPGDYIGEIQLKEILPGKVKLTYYGQEAELTL